MMRKDVRKVNGKFQLLLGKKNDATYWLQRAPFDCEWYWGIGYVEGYRGKGSSDKNWRSHQHFDRLFFNGPSDYKTMFDNFFDETPFTDREEWQILELMKSAYTCREYSDMLYTGGSHISSTVKVEAIKNDTEYERINKQVIPSILNELYKVMSPEDVNIDIFHKVNPVVR
jgi:hypothetical protein